MLTKHFFKTLFIFTVMIALGLVAVFLVSYAGERSENSAAPEEVAD